MGKVKTLRFKGTLEGSGIVNYEGNGTYQYRTNSSEAFGFGMKDLLNDNVSLAKHLFEKKKIKNHKGEEVEVIDGKIIISSNALRHYIFEGSMPFVNRNAHTSDEYLASLVAHPMYLVRGYLFTAESAKKGAEDETKKDEAPKRGRKAKGGALTKTNATIKRGRTLSITHAVQSNKTIPTLGVATNTGSRNSNSLFFKETVGDITYEFKGSINLKNLMFIEMTDENDSLSLHADHAQTFIDSFKEYTGLQIAEDQIGYYYTQGQAEKIQRYGILLNKEQINYLIKYTFKEMAKVNIDKCGGYATISSLEYLPVTNPCMLSQTYNGDFIHVTSFDDIDALDFDYEEWYTKVE